MCDKAILENGGTFKFAPDYCKNQPLCDKAVDNYPRALEFVLECNTAQKMCELQLLILTILQLNMFLNAIRVNKYVIKQFIDVFCI